MLIKPRRTFDIESKVLCTVDNVTTDPGAGGAAFVTRDIAHGGDANVQLSGVFVMGVSGSEGSYTVGAIDGDATNGLDVDVTRVIPGTSATHLGKAEDAAHGSGDTGVMALAVRRDIAAVGSGLDGEYSTLNVDATGRLWSHDPVAVALLTTMDVDTSSMSTDLSTIAAAVSTQMQVDVVAALPAGDANIGNVDIASSVALDVSAATVTVDGTGTFAVQLAAGATSIGKAENIASAPADVGVPAMARRTATPADTSGTDLDYEMIQMDNGRVWVSAAIDTALPAGDANIGNVDIASSVALDVSAATVTVDLGINNDVTIDGSSIVHAEDVAHVTGDDGIMSLAVRNDALAALATTDGDYAPLQVNASGALFIQEGAAMDVSAATVTVDGTGTFVAQITGDALTALQLIDDPVFADDAAFTLTSSKVMAIGGLHDATLSALAAAEGDIVPFRVNANGALHVTGSSGSTQYAEDIAHTTGDTGTMALAVRNDDLAALAGADGDYGPLQLTQNGALLGCPTNNDDYKYAAIDDAVSGDNTLVAAVASRKIRVLAAFMVSAGTVNARFESGAAGTALTGQMNLIANSGFVLPFNPAGWFETAVNTLLNLELSAAISVDGSLTYIEVP